jgi:hypothetical protein
MDDTPPNDTPQQIVTREDVRQLDALINALASDNPLRRALAHPSHVLNNLARLGAATQVTRVPTLLSQEDAATLRQAGRAAAYQAERAADPQARLEKQHCADVLSALAQRVSDTLGPS